MAHPRKVFQRLPLPALGLCMASWAMSPAVAHAQTSPVVQLLLTAPDARTRAQAAMTLGRLRSPDARPALETALGDREALVRVAAASTLGMLRDPVAIPALRARLQDPDANVRDAVALALSRLPGDALNLPAASPDPAGAPLDSARYLLAPGDLRDHTGSHPEHLPLLADAMLRTLAGRPGVALQRSMEIPPPAMARVRRGLLRPFSLEGGLQRLDTEGSEDSLAVRAEVQFAIVAMPRRAIVGMVTGAATARGPGFTPNSRSRLESVAVEGAVRGAMRDIEQSLSLAR